MTLLRDWNRFWFKRTSCAPVALLRIAMGLLVLASAIQLWPDRFVWFSERGLMPLAESLTYNHVYTDGPRPINFLQYATQDWEITAFFVAYILAAACMTIGLCTRSSLFLVWIGLSCIHNRESLNNTNGGDEIMIIMVMYLFMARAGGAISIDRLIRVWRGIDDPGRAPDMLIWPQRLMQVQVSIVYLCTFLNKTLGLQWQNGTAIYFPYQTLEFHRFAVPFMDGNFHYHNYWHFPIAAMNQNDMGMIGLMTYGTLAIELSLGTLIWVPRLRPYIISAGILLHLGIEYAMNIPLFAFLMIASYLSFATQEDLGRFSVFLVRTFRLTRLRVVFDGECEFCRSIALLLRSMDFLHLLRFLDYHKPNELRETPDVAFEDADQAVVAVPLPWPPRRHARRAKFDFAADWPIVDAGEVGRGMRRYAGFRAFRQIALRLPSLWPVVPLMYLPGIDILGTRAYALTSARRQRMPVAPAIRKTGSPRSRSPKRPKVGGRK